MTTYTGTDGDDVFNVGLGVHTVDAREGNDRLNLNLAGAVGNLISSHSGGVISNNLPEDDPDRVDIFIGGIERMNITTGDGNDELFLFAGDDTVSSGAGDDVINTRAGAAVVNGGDGVDVWLADLSAATVDSELDLSSAEQQAFLGGSVAAIEAVRLQLGSGRDTVRTLTGDAGRGLGDSLDGGAGKDTFLIGGGSDTIWGGAQDDLLIIDWSNALGSIGTAYGGAVISNNLEGEDQVTAYVNSIERVNITTGAGSDYLYLFAGRDTVSSGGGDDTIDSGAGAAVVDGGAGTDVWIADLSAMSANGQLDLSSSAKQNFLGGSVARIEAVQLQLGSGDDTVLTLTGTAGRGRNDNLNGGDGEDTFLIGGGRDTVVGGDGNDLLSIDFSRAAGNFTTAGSGGYISNSLTGADEATAFVSGFERVNITTGDGADNLYTTGLNDTLDGGRNADTMSGRYGDDTYYVDHKGDQVVEYVDEGTDLVYSRVTFSLEGREIENATLTGGADLRLIGNGMTNWLTGNGGDNVIYGAGGADRLKGDAGADTFLFRSTADSSPGAADRVVDLASNDTIDLSNIDADATVEGNQAFVIVDQFTNAAREVVLTYNASFNATVLAADVDGDGGADMQIILAGDQREFAGFLL